ncbi:MAG: hypothetical protein M3N14_02185 [Bacteroidota bacterium]|nr:hypothetical protein [Bacteroidota bacterium]
MKRLVILFPFLLFGCATQRSLETDPDVAKAHPKPLIIYEIGYWNTDYQILNLIDARGGHFVIRVRRDDKLVIGAVYQK